jgi:hypothetical protein
VANLAAEGRDRAFDDKARIRKASAVGEPQRLGTNQSEKIFDEKPAQTKRGYRLASVVLCQQPKVVGTEARFYWIEGLVEVRLTMGATDGGIPREIAPHV